MTYANKPLSSMSRRRAIVKRLAGFGAASFAAALVAAPMSHAVGTPAQASDTSTDTGTSNAGTPNTDAPATDAPSTDAPTTDAPTTDASSSAAPTTDAPSTDAPSIHPPSSVAAEPSPAAPGGPARAAVSAAPAVTALDEAPTPTPTPSDPAEPIFGYQKLRVGVQLAPGDAAPEGYSLANATIQISETGPGLDFNAQAVPGGVTGFQSFEPVRTCVTDATGFCPDSFVGLAATPAAAQSGDTPLQPDGDGGAITTLLPGDSAVITQLTAPDGPGLRVDPQPQNVGPCEIDADSIIPICGFPQPVVVPAAAGAPAAQPQEVTPQIPPATCSENPGECTLVLFDDPGLAPKAVNDHATVNAGAAVDIHVTVNDDLKNVPMTNLTSTAPAHGTVHRSGHVLRYTAGATFGGVDTFKYTVSTANGSATATVKVTVKAPPVAADDTAQTTGGSGAPGDPITIPVLDNDKAEGAVITLASTTTPGHGTAAVDGLNIVYTPAADFFGVDSFSYTITTANGSSTGTITVTVAAPPAAPDALASTGSASGQLMGLGATLLVVGGGASVAGRRRRTSA